MPAPSNTTAPRAAGIASTSAPWWSFYGLARLPRAWQCRLVNTLSPGKKAIGIAIGILLIPAIMWLLYGLFAFVDRYLFRL